MRLPSAKCYIFWLTVISTTLFLSQIEGSASQSDSEYDADPYAHAQKALDSLPPKTLQPRASVAKRTEAKAAPLDEPKDADYYVNPVMLQGFYEEKPEAPTESPALDNPQAFDEKYYQDLRWRMLDPNSQPSYDFLPPEWDWLWEKVLKEDDCDFYNVLIDAPFSNVLSNEHLCEEIIKFDASNILRSFSSKMKQMVSEKVNLMTENVPVRIINQINAPCTIKSAEALDKLLRIGYSEISRRCLLPNNGKLVINSDCALELTELNALPLLKEMFKGNPEFKYNPDQLYGFAIEKGSLDVLKWLNEKDNIQSAPLFPVIGALKSGHWKTIQWLFNESKNKINWNDAISRSCNDIGSHSIIKKLQGYSQFEVTEEVQNMLSAADGAMDALQKTATELEKDGTLEKLVPSSQKQDMVNAAAMAGRTKFLTWARNNIGTLPSNEAVAKACERGNFSMLHEMFDAESSRSVSTDKISGINALEYIAYAAVHNNLKEMNWISENLLNSVLPSLNDIYSQLPKVSDEAQLRVLEWAASKKEKAEVELAMIKRAIDFDNAKVLQWLYQQGLPITKDDVLLAAAANKFKVLKVMHAVKSSLVCTEEVANEAARGFGKPKYNVACWMWKTCRVLSAKTSDTKFNEWLQWMSNDSN